MKRINLLILIIIITAILCPSFVLAAVDLGVNTAADIGLGQTDLKTIIVNIIKVLLGLLGLVAIIFILYGGYTYLTAGGNEEKVTRARKILINATIGLVVILSAFAITSFIFSTLSDATGLNNGINNNGNVNLPPGGSTNLYINQWQPSNNSVNAPRNVVVYAFFNKTLDATSVTADDIVFNKEVGTGGVAFDFQVIDRAIKIIQKNPCDVEGVEYCLGETTGYYIQIVNNIKSTDGKDLICDNNLYPCESHFTTGTIIDLTGPVLTIVQPVSYSQIGDGVLTNVLAQAQDETGISYVSFQANEVNTQPESMVTSEPYQVNWQVSGYPEGSTVNLRARAEDLCGNVSESSVVPVIIRPAHCFNRVQDESETGIDCGDGCGACLGESCDSNPSPSCEPNFSACAVGSCDQVQCTCQLNPVILNILPDNGAVGNYITIFGQGFGSTPGTITFLGTPVSGDEKVAPLAACINAWSETQIIIELPVGAVTGGIKLATSGNRIDTTLDELGWQGNFTVNTTVRPGVCNINPAAGVALSASDLYGKQFTTQSTGNAVVTGGVTAAVNDWHDQNIESVIPNLNPGSVSVHVKVAGENSNPVFYQVVPDILRPSIAYLEPANGPLSTYVTIHGDNFGYNPADILVRFVNSGKGLTYPADLDFPTVCGTGLMNNNEILVKVPRVIAGELGAWEVIVDRSNKLSNAEIFTVDTTPLLSGMCLLSPDNGPITTPVDIYGEGFGLVSGLITFAADKIAAITEWTNAHTKTAVPIGSVTGPVAVKSSSGAQGNSINFSVGACVANSCVPGKECCGDGICRTTGNCAANTGADEYSWNFTTGQHLSPFIVEQVWPECEDACINAVLGIKFSNPLDMDSISDMSIGVYPCTDEQCDNLGPEIQYRYIENEVGYYDSANYILTIVPKNNLQINKKYRAVIKTGELYLVNTEGGLIENINYSTNGIFDDAYSWIFKTADRLCTLSRAGVQPNNTVLYRAEETADLTAYAYSDPDSCSPRGQQLDAYQFDWDWNSVPASIVTAMEKDVDNNGKQDPIATMKSTGPPFQDGVANVSASTLGHSSTVPVNVDLDIPVISGITPDNGMIRKDIKTLVTILGNNFGNLPNDSYVLLGNDRTGYNRVKIADCTNSWSNTQIIIEMPLNTWSGDRVKVVKNTGSAISTQTFTVNNTLRPALCSITPTFGTDDSLVTITGYNFGDTKENSTVYFGQRTVDKIDSWSNTSISARVPVGADGGPAYVKVLGTDSNTLNFDMSPYIDYLSPGAGPVRQYVSIYGGNFGNGYVQFGDTIANIADCEGSWTNKLIIAEVPESMKTGTYDVKVVKNGKLYFRDDFNMTDIDVNKWSFNKVANWRIINNSISVQSATVKQIMFSKQVVTSTDYVYNAKIKPNYPWPVGLVFNYANNNYYLLEMAEYPYTSIYTNPVTGQTSTYVYSDFKGLRIKRNGVVMAATESWIFSRNRWYDLRIEKRGGLITVFIDGTQRLSFQDPTPLPNGSVGLYSDYGYYVAFDNVIVGALDTNNIESNKKPFSINTNPLGVNLCALEPDYGKAGNQTYLRGDNFISYSNIVGTKKGAQFSAVSGSCLVNDGQYIGSCSNFTADYAFNFPTTGYYRLSAKTDNYSEDLTAIDIQHQVKVYINGVYRAEFYNLASTPDIQTGIVDLGQVPSGNHTVRLSWVNDWWGYGQGMLGDSNMRIHQVDILGERNDSKPIFTNNVQTSVNSSGMNFLNTTITAAVKSGPVKVLKNVVSGRTCIGFHIGSWCPGNVYQDSIITVESNTVPFYYNADGCMFATDSSMDPSFPPVAVENSQAVGTLATDGKYVYGKSWSSYDEYDRVINKIGTGYQGTVAGKDYGALATVTGSISLTYAPDGFLYNDACSGNNLEKIDINTGQKTTFTVSAGLLSRDSGVTGSGCKMITSDGQYMYSLSYGHDGFVYNGFKVRVYDPANGWSLVREWVSGQDSFYTDGIIADGKYVYALAWTGTVRKMDVTTGQIIDQWSTHQGHPIGHGSNVISGQYDWINKKVYLGDLVETGREIGQGIYPATGPAYLYRYSCNTEDIPTSDFFITEVKPVTPPPAPRNSLIRLFFNNNIEPTSFANEDVLVQNITPTEPEDLAYTANITGNLLELTANATCPAPNTNLFCWPALSTIKVTTNEGSIMATDAKALGCFNGKCTHQFASSNAIDLTPPSISIIEPVNNARITQNSVVPIIAEATDDSGVSYVEFFVDDQQKARVATAMAFETNRSYETVYYGTRALSADFNKDGYEDLAIFTYWGTSYDILLNNGQGKFLPRKNYSLGENYIYSSPVIGDINNDGYSDIIILSMWSNGKYAVILNKGNGQFKDPVWHETGFNYTYRAVLGDFDKDGDLDMAISNYASYYSSISVALYKNTNGTFSQYQTINYGNTYSNYPRGIVATDFNNDGYADLAVYKNSWDSNDSKRLYIYLSAGASGQMLEKSTSKRADWITDMVAGDFNNDGNQDLAYVSYYYYNYGPGEVLYGNGDGTFGNIQAIKQYTSSSYSNYNYLQAINVDHDGGDDLVINNSWPYQITYLISNGYTFAKEKIISTASGWHENFAFVDVNNDEYLDLAIPDYSGSTQIFENNQDTTFGINRIMSTQPGTTSFQAQDLDGDNIPELVVAASNQYSYYTNSANSYISVYRSNSVNNVSYQNVWQKAVSMKYVSGTGTYTTTGAPQAVGLSDFNKDQYQDIAISNYRWDVSDRQVYLSTGKLNWATATYLPSQSSIGIYGHMEIGDLDGGGDPDLLSVSMKNKFEAKINNGQGVFTEQIIDPGTIEQWSINAIAWADLNGDGKSDLIYSSNDSLNIVYNNKGQYDFTQKISYIDDWIQDILTADIDNDGDQDILVSANANRGWLSVYKNIGGEFQSRRIPLASNTYAWSGATGDLNNDGLVDFVNLDSNGKVSVLYNQGNGNFGQETVLKLMSYSYGYSDDKIKIVDVNRDNVPDVLVVDSSGSGIIFVYNKQDTNLYSWNWDTVGLAKNTTHKLQAKAYDLDSNAKLSSPINVTIVAEHCTNLVQDEDETGIDCGGVDCLVCPQSGDFHIVSKRPEGSGVCTNEAVRVTFNKPMDRVSISNSSVQVRCRGRDCPVGGVVSGTFSFTDLQDSAPKTFIFYPNLPNQQWLPFLEYQVYLLAGQIRSLDGDLLAPQSWQFDSSDAQCAVDKIELTPPSATVGINKETIFTALVKDKYDNNLTNALENWSSADATIANINPAIINGDFSDDLTGWSSFVTGTSEEIVAIEDLNNNKYLTITGSGRAEEAEAYIIAQQFIDIERDSNYALSFNVRVSDGVRKAGVEIWYVNDENNRKERLFESDFIGQTDWSYHSFNFDISSGKIELNCYLQDQDDHNPTYISCDNLQLIRGDSNINEIQYFQGLSEGQTKAQARIGNIVGDADLNVELAPDAPRILEEPSCSNGKIQSPSPQRNATNVCRQAAVSALFTQDLDPTTVNNANIYLAREQESACQSGFLPWQKIKNLWRMLLKNTTLNSLAAVDKWWCPVSGRVTPFYQNDKVRGFIFSPDTNLGNSVHYRMTVTTGVKSITGVPVAVNDSWSFATATDADCAVATVSVEPATKDDLAIGVKQNYTSMAYTNQCFLINSSGLNWSWSSANRTIAQVLPAVNNQDFEDDDAGLSPTIWQAADNLESWQVVSVGAPHGNAVTQTAPNAKNYLYQNISGLIPNKSYHITVWFKRTGPTDAGTGQIWFNDIAIPLTGNYNTWNQIDITRPIMQDELQIRLIINSGTVYFDDINIEMVGDTQDVLSLTVGQTTVNATTSGKNGSGSLKVIPGNCGNNRLDPEEICDFVLAEVGEVAVFNPSDLTCEKKGYSRGGTLQCTSACQLDTNLCLPGLPPINECINKEVSVFFRDRVDPNSLNSNGTGLTCLSGPEEGNSCSDHVDCPDSYCGVVNPGRVELREMDISCRPVVKSDSGNRLLTLYDQLRNFIKVKVLRAANCNGTSLSIQVYVNRIGPYSKIYVLPVTGLQANKYYTLTVAGGSDGISFLPTGYMATDYTSSFSTGLQTCLLDRVEITPSAYSFNEANKSATFSATAYDQNNNAITNASYTWSVVGNGSLVSLVNPNNRFTTLSASGAGNGDITLHVNVNAGAYGQGQAELPINIFLCSLPWTYQESNFNFSTRYCRTQDKNIVYNSNMETDIDSNNIADGYDQWHGELHKPHEIKIVSEANNKYWQLYSRGEDQGGEIEEYMIVSQAIMSIVPGKKYTFSSKIKTTMPGASGNCNDGFALMELWELNANGVRIPGQSSNTTICSTADWQTKAITRQVSANAKGVEINCGLRVSSNENAITVSCDDWQLEANDQATVYQAGNVLPALEMKPGTVIVGELTNNLFTLSKYGIYDAIGVRTYANYNHFSPQAWYQNNAKYQGSPTSLAVNKYSAINEGRSTYINFANVVNTDQVYTNILLISYTDQANTITQTIYNDFYKNLTFNSNLTDVNSREKLARDTKRWEDIYQLRTLLQSYKSLNNNYPILLSGTYLPNTSVSAWDSWQSTFGTILGGTVPQDPVNTHQNCPAGYDPITCWRPATATYYCSNSHVYKYKYETNSYNIFMNFEFDGRYWMHGFNSIYPPDRTSIGNSTSCESVKITPTTISNNIY